MQPQQEWLARLLVQPANCMIHRDVGRTRGGRLPRDLIDCFRNLIVVDSKALIEAELPIQHSRTNESCRIPTRSLQNRCQCYRGRLQREPAGIPNMVDVRVFASKDARVRGSRQRRLRNCFFKQDAVSGQCVDGGRLDFVVAIAMQMVRPHRIQRDHHNVDRLAFYCRVCNFRCKLLLMRSRARR